MKLKSIHTGVDIKLPNGSRHTWLNVGNGQQLTGLAMTLTTMEGTPIVAVTGKGIDTDEPICIPLVNVRSFVPMKPEDEKPQGLTSPIARAVAEEIKIEAQKKKKKSKE